MKAKSKQEIFAVEKKYGAIGTWDTSAVTDMSGMFSDAAVSYFIPPGNTSVTYGIFLLKKFSNVLYYELHKYTLELKQVSYCL